VSTTDRGPSSRTPSEAANEPSAARAARKEGEGGDFQRAVNRLEGAVDELVTMAKEQFSDRATSVVQDTADRLEREIENRRGRSRGSRGSRRRHRDGPPSWLGYTGSWNWGGVRPDSRGGRENPYRTRRLFRDVKRQRVGGVCAGIARYFGAEVWVTRCIALTGLIFMPQIIVPAYFIAWWVMDDASKGEKVPEQTTTNEPVHATDHSSPAPELGTRLSPRRSLRDVQYSMDQIELKLRRMETHVTSGQYELQRELKKIDT
jgi:phage shock protein C